MQGRDILDPTYLPQRTKVGNMRKIILLVLSLILWLLGSLISIPAASRAIPLHKIGNHITRTVRPAPTPLPPTPTPTPIPTPAPVTPFPTSLAQQIAVLQAHDRFFYGGNPRLPEIALTFDDGPNPPYTGQILAILQHYGIKATFFCVGSLVKKFPVAVRQEAAEGHLVENHSWGHPYMPYLSAASVIWQLSTTQDLIQHTIGVRPIFFRPPYGAFNSTVLTYANYFGLTTFMWNVDPRDWSKPGADVIYARVLAQTQPGSIILMHDGGGDRSQTVAALPKIITWFLSRGYRFVTLQELVNDAHKDPSKTTKNKPIDVWRRYWQTQPHKLCMLNVAPEHASVCISI
jgi:peptidoglycan/xylan/chitin deacetylase (PgdA/CDA1 family)